MPIYSAGCAILQVRYAPKYIQRRFYVLFGSIFRRGVAGNSENTFHEIIDKYIEMNVAHPFMEGNGRSTRIWLDLILKKRLGKCVDWSKISKNDYIEAMEESHIRSDRICALLHQALTEKIHDREIFMKGIDYSYSYEQGIDICFPKRV